MEIVAERPDENAVLPGRELVTAVEDQARRVQLRIPEEKRLIHARRARFGNLGTRSALRQVSAVRPAQRNMRPAVVVARLDVVEFVSPLRSELDFPQLA